MQKDKKRLRQANGNAYINLQLSCEELPYDLVSLAKTEELPDGCARDEWERLTSEYDLTEGEDKITLLSMFQQNQLEDVRTIITVWLTSLAIQVNKLKKLNRSLISWQVYQKSTAVLWSKSRLTEEQVQHQ